MTYYSGLSGTPNPVVSRRFGSAPHPTTTPPTSSSAVGHHYYIHYQTDAAQPHRRPLHADVWTTGELLPVCASLPEGVGSMVTAEGV